MADGALSSGMPSAVANQRLIVVKYWSLVHSLLACVAIPALVLSGVADGQLWQKGDVQSSVQVLLVVFTSFPLTPLAASICTLATCYYAADSVLMVSLAQHAISSCG